MRPNIWYLHQEKAEEEEEIDVDPEQLTIITQERAEHVTSSRRLDNGGDWTILYHQRICYALETVLFF